MNKKIQQNITTHLSEPKRKNPIATSTSSSTSYLILALLLLLLIIFSAFLFLIITTSDKNRKLTSKITTLNNQIKELNSLSYSYDANCNELTAENEKMDHSIKSIKDNGTDLMDKTAVMQKRINDQYVHVTQLENSISSLNQSIQLSRTQSMQLIEELDKAVKEEGELNSKVEGLRQMIVKRKEEVKACNTKDKDNNANGSGNNSNGLIDSQIIINKDQLDQLNSLLVPNKNRHINYALLYRASSHSFSPNEFHMKCDEDSIKNSLVVILLNDMQVIGGFTMNNWSPNANGDVITIKRDNAAFVFNLGSGRRFGIEKNEGAIICDKNVLPQFGLGDIEIKNMKLISSFPKSFGLEDKAKQFELTNGVNVSLIKEIEVFTLLFSEPKV